MFLLPKYIYCNEDHQIILQKFEVKVVLRAVYLGRCFLNFSVYVLHISAPDQTKEGMLSSYLTQNFAGNDMTILLRCCMLYFIYSPMKFLSYVAVFGLQANVTQIQFFCPY